VVTGLFVLHPFGSDASLDQKIMYHINPLKDVEGLHPSWMGDLTHYRKTVENQTEPKLIVPCTPKAVMKICERHFHSDFFQEDYQKQEGYLKGHKVVVVNYTHIVGLPLSLMFRNEKATVTPVDENSPPDYLKHLMSQADILVSAVGKPGFKIKAEDVKPNSLVIDVAGDFESDVTLIADYVSNKGVSKVTQATLLNNLNSVHELQKYFKLGGTDPVLTPYARELKIC